MGGRRVLQLFAHRILVLRRGERSRRQESVHREPHRRFRVAPGDGAARGLRGRARLGRHRRRLGLASATGSSVAARAATGLDGVAFAVPLPAAPPHGRDRDRPLPLPRVRGQERADPALRLASRRDGRPYAGERAHPRRDDGHRGCLPRVPALGRLSLVAFHDGDDRDHRRRDRALRGHHRHRPKRHQESARLFHGEPARLHVHGRRCRCVLRRVLPRLHARVLQGLPLPRRGLGHPRDARGHPRFGRRAGHAKHGRAVEADAADRSYVPRLLLRDCRVSSAVRLLLEGRDPLPRVCDAHSRGAISHRRRRSIGLASSRPR